MSDRPAASLVYIVAPEGAAGGGMGRVKDYIVQSPVEWWGGFRPVPLVTRDVGGKAQSLSLLFRSFATIRRSHKKGELAFVHVNMGDRGSALRKGLVIMTCRALGVPVFLHLHAVEMHKLKARTLRRLATAFRSATAVIVLGEVYRRFVREELAITDTPVEILWNGVPVSPVEGRRHVQPVDRPLTLLFLGALGERKGVSDLIAALAMLPRDGQGWRAILAGPGDVESYRAKAVAAGIADHVLFTGWLDQETSRQAMRDADALILPSYEEGLPLVILEALGLGTPVITTSVGAIPEVLTDGRDVLFCQPGDPASLHAAIERLSSNAALRQTLCDNGLELFHRTFSIRSFCENLLAIWKRHLPG